MRSLYTVLRDFHLGAVDSQVRIGALSCRDAVVRKFLGARIPINALTYDEPRKSLPWFMDSTIPKTFHKEGRYIKRHIRFGISSK
jgi:hypothetical protein